MNKALVSVRNIGPNKWSVRAYHSGYKFQTIECSFERLESALSERGMIMV